MEACAVHCSGRSSQGKEWREGDEMDAGSRGIFSLFPELEGYFVPSLDRSTHCAAIARLP